ncbi:hypothetical protein JCM8547_003285 [Rhodosporidiobolus lusitaniae]
MASVLPRRALRASTPSCTRSFFSFGSTPAKPSPPAKGTLTRQGGLYTYREDKVMPYSPSQLYSVIADVDLYKNFLPFTSSSRVLSATRILPSAGREKRPLAEKGWLVQPGEAGERWEMDAELRIGAMGFDEGYVSLVEMDKGKWVKATAKDASMFRHLSNLWTFTPVPSSPQQPQTKVDLHLVYQFTSPLHAAAMSAVWDKVSALMVQKFEERVNVILQRILRILYSSCFSPSPLFLPQSFLPFFRSPIKAATSSSPTFSRRFSSPPPHFHRGLSNGLPLPSALLRLSTGPSSNRRCLAMLIAAGSPSSSAAPRLSLEQPPPAYLAVSPSPPYASTSTVDASHVGLRRGMGQRQASLPILRFEATEDPVEVPPTPRHTTSFLSLRRLCSRDRTSAISLSPSRPPSSPIIPPSYPFLAPSPVTPTPSKHYGIGGGAGITHRLRSSRSTASFFSRTSSPSPARTELDGVDGEVLPPSYQAVQVEDAEKENRGRSLSRKRGKKVRRGMGSALLV